MRLKDKIAVVTGGGQGIGRGISLMFAREGAKLAIAQRTAEKLERTRKDIENLGAEVLAVPTDVRRPEEVQRLIEATQERFGGLDVLVNNAGIGLRVPVDEVTLEDYDRVMDTNLKGLYMGCHFAVPLMKARGQGSIINISSVHGVDGCPLNTVYAATKGGIIGCTRALAAELAPFLIRVNTISPGAIRIHDPEEQLGRILAHVAEQFHDEFRQRFGERLREGSRYYQPLEIVGEPEDIAYAAVWLAADEARFVTGQNIVVDGGLTTYLSGNASDNARKQAAGSPWHEVREWVQAHLKEGVEWPPRR
jgi:meso-butanediol dehydrogenase / (S,S)-butanediol dehydrogenase / diacetyl reductase